MAVQDQPYFGTSYRVNVTTQSQLSVNASFAIQATEAYLQNQTGPLTNPSGNSVGKSICDEKIEA